MNHLVLTCSTWQMRFVFRSCRSNRTPAELLDHLYEQETHASGGRMNQRCLTSLERIRRVRQIMRRHSLEHGGCGLLKIDPVWNSHESVGRDCGKLRIGPEH